MTATSPLTPQRTPGEPRRDPARDRAILDTLRRPLRDLRISVTDRCNFRCTYCMPAEIYGERYQFIPKSQILTFEEIARLARVFVSLGTRKIRLTGGEPLVRADVPRLVAMLAAIDGLEDLAMTTNGYLLADLAPALKHAGLRRITRNVSSGSRPIASPRARPSASAARLSPSTRLVTSFILAPAPAGPV